MTLDQSIEHLRAELDTIYAQGSHLSGDLFRICPRCRRRVIETAIEISYCNRDRACGACRTAVSVAIRDVAKLFGAMHLGDYMSPQEYFGDRSRRKNLLAMLNGIFSIGPMIPCSYPKTCSFELTYRCNLKCRHCYLGEPVGDNDPGTEVVLRIIGGIARAGFVSVVLSGGEPLLRDDLCVIVEEIKKYDMEALVSTNGTLLSMRRVRQLEAAKVDMICVSLDSDIESLHDGFRGVKGAHRLAMTGIRNCIERDIPVRTFTTLTKFNHDRLPELIDLAEAYGVKEMAFFDLNPVGKASDTGPSDQLTIEEFRAAVSVLDTRDSEGCVRVNALAPYSFHESDNCVLDMTLLSGGFCNAGISTLNVSPDGDVQACSRLRMSLGDATTDEISSIWLSSPILSMLRDRSRLGGICGNCEHKFLCGGCRANAQATTERYMAEDPRCIPLTTRPILRRDR